MVHPALKDEEIGRRGRQLYEKLVRAQVETEGNIGKIVCIGFFKFAGYFARIKYLRLDKCYRFDVGVQQDTHVIIDILARPLAKFLSAGRFE